MGETKVTLFIEDFRIGLSEVKGTWRKWKCMNVKFNYSVSHIQY